MLLMLHVDPTLAVAYLPPGVACCALASFKQFPASSTSHIIFLSCSMKVNMQVWVNTIVIGVGEPRTCSFSYTLSEMLTPDAQLMHCNSSLLQRGEPVTSGPTCSML